MVIICDISAWQYWRTPPIIKNSEVPLELALAPKDAGGLGMDRRLFFPRANAREADRLISTSILTDLKSLTLPIHVMVDGETPRRSNGFIVYHRAPLWLSDTHFVELGSGLAVLSIPALFETLGRRYGPIDLAGALCEACGTYALFHETAVSRIVYDELIQSGVIKKLAYRKADIIRQFYEPDGKKAPLCTSLGKEIPWQPTLNKSGAPTDLWKRPPLTTLEELQVFANVHARSKGTSRFARSLTMVREGLASPLETQAALLFTAPKVFGGEALPVPHFNQKIELSQAAQKLAGTTYCIGDFVWEEQKVIFEANGYDYHFDHDGFYIKSGRTSALQSMGYTVHEMNYAQMTDIEQYEAIVQSICSSLDVKMRPRTAKFSASHHAMRESIFDPRRLWG